MNRLSSRRAALGEHAPQAAPVEDLEHHRRVDAVGVRAGGVDDLGQCAEPAAGVVDGLAARQDQRRHLGAGEQLGVVLEVGAVGDDGDRRHLGLPAALAILALRDGHLCAGVVLDAHGRRADEDDVGFLPHPGEQGAVTGPGQPT